MKSVRFSLINKKFDDQYTFDLQGYVRKISIKHTALYSHIWNSYLYKIFVLLSIYWINQFEKILRQETSFSGLSWYGFSGWLLSLATIYCGYLHRAPMA